MTITGGAPVFVPHCAECARSLRPTGGVSARIKYIEVRGDGQLGVQATIYWCSVKCLTQTIQRCKGNFKRVI